MWYVWGYSVLLYKWGVVVWYVWGYGDIQFLEYFLVSLVLVGVGAS